MAGRAGNVEFENPRGKWCARGSQVTVKGTAGLTMAGPVPASKGRLLLRGPLMSGARRQAETLRRWTRTRQWRRSRTPR
jgi:hypothetical protein